MWLPMTRADPNVSQDLIRECPRYRSLAVVVFPLVIVASTGCAGSPSYLRTFGYVADRQAALGRVVLLIALVVTVVVAVLVLAAGVRGSRGDASALMPESSAGISWIIIGGVVVPTVV